MARKITVEVDLDTGATRSLGLVRDDPERGTCLDCGFSRSIVLHPKDRPMRWCSKGWASRGVFPNDSCDTWVRAENPLTV